MRWAGFWLVGGVLGLCACRTLSPSPVMPERNSIVREQLVIYCDFPLPSQHRLIDELTAQRGDVAELLKLPPTDEPIHVFLFSSADKFQDYIDRHHSDFPARRAFFVETDTRLAVYAHWGDRIAEDLRHEVAHGYLHAAVPSLPLWLDEGIAEYFEVPRGHQGYNPPHVAQLQARILENGWQPNLRRLESFASPADMTQLDYAESWAWVHMMLQTTPERRAVLHNYLQALRKDGAAPPFSLAVRTLHPEPDQELAEYLRTLGK